MDQIMKRQMLLIIGLVTLLACTTRASQEQLAQSIKDAQVEATRTSEQLKATLSTITALTKQKKGDLRPAYDAFSVEVTKTESAAVITKDRAHWMATDGQQYFQEWQKSVNEIANPSLQKKSQKRLNTVKASYDKVEASMQLASDKFKPFLSDLSDMQKALASDVTPAGVKALSGTVRDANWSYKSVDKAIQSAIKEMGKMQKALSSEAK